MGRFVRGDIVVFPFPFSDLSSSKRRPAVVLISDAGDDIVLCQITSKNVCDDKSIEINIADVENGSLKDISNARPNKLFTADEKIILYKLGNLSEAKLDEVVKAIVSMLLG
ncbi:MAG: type II toxin-antitoxin system PemK/MazF family toxin [Clostridiales bacterium]|nr:type II toxin-antitoxin system PemK/MazF family toxin [Clostridiales bacterium]